MHKGMGFCHFSTAVCNDLLSACFMREIITDFIDKIRFTFIEDKVLIRYKEIKEVALKIGKQKSATSHNIHAPERNTGPDAFKVILRLIRLCRKTRGMVL